jgi:hypothetical protein
MIAAAPMTVGTLGAQVDMLRSAAYRRFEVAGLRSLGQFFRPLGPARLMALVFRTVSEGGLLDAVG